MPVMDGITALKEIRKSGDKTYVLMLTAKAEVDDRVTGLDSGADDYIIKPFEAKEVMARIHAVLRRTSPPAESEQQKEINWDKLSINLTNYELRINGTLVDAPPKEMDLLYYLASNPNKVFTRDQLLDKVWGFDYYGDSRTVDVHIKRLREKINGVSDQWGLKTIWGIGYKFDVRS